MRKGITELDRAMAMEFIRSKTYKLKDTQIATILCALLGHPPVVEDCLGQITCARCDAQLGDTLGGVFDLKGYMVVGHDCDECRKVRASLVPTQELYTKLESK